MAYIKGADEEKKGRVGSITYFERAGRVEARIATRIHGTPTRTLKSMDQKMRMANLVNCWRQLSIYVGMKDNFENKRPGQTDYNMFISNNIRNASVFLTKREAKLGETVMENFVISDGSLRPQVQLRREGDWFVSDIYVGGLEIDDETTVGTLAKEVYSRNRASYHIKDEIRFYTATPRLVDAVKEEYLVTDVRGGTLALADWNDARRVRQVAGLHELGVVEGYLACPWVENRLVGWVHRRRDWNGRWIVSTQTLVGENDEVAYFNTQMNMLRAAESYGKVVPSAGFYVGSAQEELQKEISQMEAMAAPAAKRKVRVEAQAMPAEGGFVKGQGEATVGQTLTLEAVPAYGWRFLGWGDGLTEPEREWKAERNEKIYAFFSQN